MPRSWHAQISLVHLVHLADAGAVSAEPDVVPAAPAAARELTSGADLALVWHSELGGLTYRWPSDAAPPCPSRDTVGAWSTDASAAAA